MFNASELGLRYYAIIATLLASLGPAIQLQIVQQYSFPHSHPFTIKCFFLTPRDQRDVFVVPSTFPLPPLFLPSSPLSAAHQPAAPGINHSHQPPSDELMEPISCSGHFPGLQQPPGSHLQCTEFTASFTTPIWLFV